MLQTTASATACRSACAHGAQLVNKLGQGIDSVPSEAETVAFLSAISGYDRAPGATTNGSDAARRLGEWHDQGIGGNKIVAFAQDQGRRRGHGQGVPLTRSRSC